MRHRRRASLSIGATRSRASSCFPDRARAAQCSSQREVPATLPAVSAQPRAHARTRLRYRRIRLRRHKRDLPGQTIDLGLEPLFFGFLRSPSLRQYRAGHYRIFPAPHRPKPNARLVRHRIAISSPNLIAERSVACAGQPFPCLRGDGYTPGRAILTVQEGASAECGPVSPEYLTFYSARRLRAVSARQLRTDSAQVPQAVALAEVATAPDGERRYDLYGATKSKRMRPRLARGLTQPSTGRKTDR